MKAETIEMLFLNFLSKFTTSFSLSNQDEVEKAFQHLLYLYMDGTVITGAEVTDLFGKIIKKSPLNVMVFYHASSAIIIYRLSKDEVILRLLADCHFPIDEYTLSVIIEAVFEEVVLNAILNSEDYMQIVEEVNGSSVIHAIRHSFLNTSPFSFTFQTISNERKDGILSVLLEKINEEKDPYREIVNSNKEEVEKEIQKIVNWKKQEQKIELTQQYKRAIEALEKSN